MRRLFLTASKAAAFLPEEATRAQRMRSAVQALTTAAAEWKQNGTLPTPAAVPPKVIPEPPKKDKLPQAPSDFLLDEATAFDPPAAAALKTKLVKFHTEQDMDVYVVTSIYLPERTAQALAEKLAEKWLLDRYGAVVVMNRGTAPGEGALGIALAPNDSRLIGGRTLFSAVEEARAKSEEITNRPEGSRAAGVEAAAQVLMDTLTKSGGPALAKQSAVTSRSQWNVMTGVASALLVGAVFLFLFHRVQERLERRSNEQFRFPDVTVGRRLGATQGGGNVAGISFGPKTPQ